MPSSFNCTAFKIHKSQGVSQLEVSTVEGNCIQNVCTHILRLGVPVVTNYEIYMKYANVIDTQSNKLANTEEEKNYLLFQNENTANLVSKSLNTALILSIIV